MPVATNSPVATAQAVAPNETPAGGLAQPAPTATASITRVDLPDLFSRFPPPPIFAIPKATIQIAGSSLDAYQLPGDRIRLVCQQPCALDERLIDSLYVGYKVTSQQDVRTAGIDLVDKIKTLDIHLTRDATCTRREGELGLTGSYPDDQWGVFICLYLNEPDLQNDVLVPFTPEGAIRAGGLGVFAHEYAHALLLGRFASSHDFVFPIEYVTLDQQNRGNYRDLCNSAYQGGAPLTYTLCKSKGLTFDQLIQSLLDIDTLSESGLGNFNGLIGYNQYKAILSDILGSDVSQVFTDSGYAKIFVEEGHTTYVLPYANDPCRYRASLVSDVTVPLGTMLDANTTFDKTWKIKNTGSCNWDGVQLVYTRGEAMTSTKSVPVPSTAAGESVDISVPMTAPADEGVHIGEWRLRNATGKDFGPLINLTLYTRPGCSLPPKLSFFQAEPATIGQGALSLLSWGQVNNVDKVEIAGIGPVDPNGNRMLLRLDKTTTFTLQATCGTNTVKSEATITVDPALPPFAVSNVQAVADPANYTGACSAGVKIVFSGIFDSNGPGVVLYQWSRADGSIPASAFSILDKAGTHTVTSTWFLGSSTQSGLEFKLVAPLEGQVVPAGLTLTCTP